MRFTKMHGLGNDYVYVNCFEEQIENPSELAPKVSDRHFGIGGDGLILVMPSDLGDVRMRMFNSDGSEAQMCGNGVRCVAKYAHDHGLSDANPIRVETAAGVKSIQLDVDADDKVATATVDMGEPILDSGRIPVKVPQPTVVNVPIRLNKNAYTMTCVSMGNPHAVIFVPDVRSIPLEEVGPQVENHPLFPERVNAHWVQKHSDEEVTMVTWERGSGVTLACGTGASAVCVAGVLTGNTARKITAHLPGGNLVLEWRESDNHVLMTGPATEVFTGEWNV
ncbi:MAG: diaminopimelate epimerase [Phycisphaerae bacterium]